MCFMCDATKRRLDVARGGGRLPLPRRRLHDLLVVQQELLLLRRNDWRVDVP